jgi:hypothetical protein
MKAGVASMTLYIALMALERSLGYDVGDLLSLLQAIAIGVIIPILWGLDE